MPIQSHVGRDGSARVTIDGQEQKFRADSVEAARDRVLAIAREYAAETGYAQHLVANDPEGSWPMYVYPDGTTIAAPLPVITPPPPTAALFHQIDREPSPEPAQAAAAPEPDTNERTELADHTVVIPCAPARPTLIIHVEGGVAITATPPVVLGRRPADRTGHEAVALDSPRRECSRTHAVIDVDDECRLIVTDQNAPNGTLADGAPLTANTPTIVSNGARLQLGDVALRVEAFPPEPHSSAAAARAAQQPR